MAPDGSKLEPAENDPVKNRRTALVLLALIVVGGVMIMVAYMIKRKGDLAERAKGRPPIVARLKSNFAVVRHDGETVAISDLKGKVWLATTICLSQPEDTAETLRAMQAVAGDRPAEDRLRFVCFTIDPERDRPADLAAFAGKLGLADDERWWFVAAGEEKLRAYLKNQLRLGAVTEGEQDGRPWLRFDPLITLVDGTAVARNGDPLMHIRGRYDFHGARAVENDAKRLIETEPERIEEFTREFKQHPETFTNEVQELEATVLRHIDYVLNEELKEGTEL
ncbi:MAG: hypothetical protein HKN82_05955 [Akkermansiaceae bacterium]|nr:hypothetical protein [Akkermansiaceae bacterium]NNM28686.1 hypothetical protein [Akkermansiaceae bacterium]